MLTLMIFCALFGELIKKLYILNITRLDIKELIFGIRQNPLQEILKEIKQNSNIIADELLTLLHKVAASGPIKSLLNADTAIGRTLESLLNIPINSSRKPEL